MHAANAMRAIPTRGWTTAKKVPKTRIVKISQPATPSTRSTARASTSARAGRDHGENNPRGDGGKWRKTLSFAGVEESFDEFKGLFALPKRRDAGDDGGGLGFHSGRDHDDDDTSVAKHDMMKVFLPLALCAAVASVGYLINVVRMNAKHGVADLLYKLIFDDVWASIAMTVLVLYTNFANKSVNVTFTAAANFIRPERVNMLWWVSLFIQRSITHLTSMINVTLVWSLGNSLWSLIPLGIDLIKIDNAATDGIHHVNTLLTTMLDANNDGIVTTTELQMWFVAKTLRLLWCFYFFRISQWFMALKSAPTIQEMRTRGTSYDREDFMSQALRHHFAGLRGDRGVSWDQQARSALIDKALSIATYLFGAYWCLSSLGVNMTGLLAVGGVSGIAIGFAAQKLVSNCIGGILIFVTQPFVEGDHVQFGSIEGRVELVGWHSTRISSLEDGFSYIVPNTDVLGSALRNLSRREYIPIKETIPFPDSIKTKDQMQRFMDDITKLVVDTVDEWSVRKPVVHMTFDGLTPKIRIKAFIDGSKDKSKAEDLTVKLMRDIVDKLDDPFGATPNTTP